MHLRGIAQGNSVTSTATLTSDGVAVGSRMQGNEVAQNRGSPLLPLTMITRARLKTRTRNQAARKRSD